MALQQSSGGVPVLPLTISTRPLQHTKAEVQRALSVGREQWQILLDAERETNIRMMQNSRDWADENITWTNMSTELQVQAMQSLLNKIFPTLKIRCSQKQLGSILALRVSNRRANMFWRRRKKSKDTDAVPPRADDDQPAQRSALVKDVIARESSSISAARIDSVHVVTSNQGLRRYTSPDETEEQMTDDESERVQGSVEVRSSYVDLTNEGSDDLRKEVKFLKALIEGKDIEITAYKDMMQHLKDENTMLKRKFGNRSHPKERRNRSDKAVRSSQADQPRRQAVRN